MESRRERREPLYPGETSLGPVDLRREFVRKTMQMELRKYKIRRSVWNQRFQKTRSTN